MCLLKSYSKPWEAPQHPNLEIWQVHPISKHPKSGRLSFACCDKQTKLTSNKENTPGPKWGSLQQNWFPSWVGLLLLQLLVFKKHAWKHKSYPEHCLSGQLDGAG